MKIKTECDRYYCPKCNKLYNDEKHKGYLIIGMDESDCVYHFDHCFNAEPADDTAYSCPKCGSDIMRVGSIAMSILVYAMIDAGFKIKGISDGFLLSMEGAQRFDYGQRYEISFTVPAVYKAEFDDKKSVLIREHDDGIYYASLITQDDVTKLRDTIESIASDAGKTEWMINYLPKIFALLLSKGYNIVSAATNDYIKDGYFSYEISLLNPIPKSENTDNPIMYAKDTAIEFEHCNRPATAEKQLKWVEALPKYKEA